MPPSTTSIKATTPVVPFRRGFGQSFATFCTRGVRSVRGARRALATPATVVLALHAIVDLSDDPAISDYGIPRERFAKLLDSLTRRGWSFVDLDQFLRFLDGREAAPRRGVLVTFDDGYADLVTDALPVLHERGIPGVAFAVAGRVGGTNEWDLEIGARTLDLAGKDDLLTLAEHGIEIGARRLLPLRLGDGSSRRPAARDRRVRRSARDARAAAAPRPGIPLRQLERRGRRGSLAKWLRRGVHRRLWGRERGTSACHALPRVGISAHDTPLRLQVKILAARLPEPWRGRLFRLTGIRPQGGSSRRDA